MIESIVGERQTPPTSEVREQWSETTQVTKLSVAAVDGIQALERFSAQIDRLNLASARPNAFLSSAFLYCYALRIEYFTPGREERLFLVWDGDRLVGCAPMRRSINNFGPAFGPLGLRSVRLGFLAPLDTEQSGLLCAPEDEERVAVALIRYICEQERDWGILEFAGQRPGGALHRATHGAANRKFRARDIAVEPFNEISLVWPDLAAYFRSLAKKMRSNISRQARRLFASGEAELILAEGPAAVTAWFEAYCDLDSRSWKHGTVSSIQRHPRRVRFYREIAAGRGGIDPSFIGLILDGVLVAGLIAGDNASSSPQRHGAWCLEMAYDNTRSDLGPGQLLLLLAVGEAIKRGDKFLNFLQNFAYYKRRWKADPIDVVNVQLIRRFSLHDARGFVGELKKRLHAKRTPAPIPDSGNEDDEPDVTGDGPAAPPPDLERARQLTAAAFAYAGTGIRRLDRASARAYLPFQLD